MNISRETITKIIRVAYLLMVILLIAYIFSNSIESKAESSSKSNSVVEVINKSLKKINPKFQVTDLFVRKSAHFAEFFVLGASLFGYLLLLNKVSFHTSFYMIFISCLTAMTDETIQYFSKRGSMLLDVWLDLCASVIAIGLFYLIYKYIKRKKKSV